MIFPHTFVTLRQSTSKMNFFIFFRLGTIKTKKEEPALSKQSKIMIFECEVKFYLTHKMNPYNCLCLCHRICLCLCLCFISRVWKRKLTTPKSCSLSSLEDFTATCNKSNIISSNGKIKICQKLFAPNLPSLNKIISWDGKNEKLEIFWIN